MGRNRLVNDLYRAGIEVSQPLRDRGIDVIAYFDLAIKDSKFQAVPIEIKASSTQAFSVNRKYAKISNLVIAYIWGLSRSEEELTFALTYSEATEVAEKMGWTATASWAKGNYSTSSPSKKLRHLLEPFEMTPEKWVDKLRYMGA